MPDRRHCLLALLGAPWFAAAAPLRSLAVIPLDFVEDHPRPDPGGVQARRLADAHAQLQHELAEAGLYRIVDFAPAAAQLGELRRQQELIHRCADCAQQLGRRLGAELAMTAWVQKVSELILNLNVEVIDVASGRPILAKSVDLRGNTDETWRRAVAFLVRDMADKRARNPRYGT